MRGRGFRLSVGCFIPLFMVPMTYGGYYMIFTKEIMEGVRGLAAMLFFHPSSHSYLH